MGTPFKGSRCEAGHLSAPKQDGIITHFYTSDAWIDGRAEDQLKQVSTWAGVTKIAAFPDLHVGKYGPVGCAVLADRIYPQLIGNDIGCGMSLFQLDLSVRKFKIEKAARRFRALGDPLEAPQSARLEEIGLPVDLFAQALGTIGGGNHFCEVQTLSDITQQGFEVPHSSDLDMSRLYLLVHSGSRGLGEATLSTVTQEAFQGLEAESEEGFKYVVAHEKAVLWARLNRQIIAERAAETLRAQVRLIADALEYRTQLGGMSEGVTEGPAKGMAKGMAEGIAEDITGGWLHRKGAAVAGDMVPLAGSRATPSYLVRPLPHVTGQPDALASLAHGAGRRYDRSSMHGRVQGRKSDLDAMQRTPFGGRVICEDRDLLIEEAPQAYKSAQKVVADLEQTGVAQTLATFNPLLTFKKIRPNNSQANSKDNSRKESRT